MTSKNFKINSDKILFTQLGDDAVLYDIENNAYLSMNSTFSSIFQGIQEGLNSDGIFQKLMDEYEVDADVCQTQLNQSIEILLDKGFISEAA